MFVCQLIHLAPAPCNLAKEFKVFKLRLLICKVGVLPENSARESLPSAKIVAGGGSYPEHTKSWQDDLIEKKPFSPDAIPDRG